MAKVMNIGMTWVATRLAIEHLPDGVGVVRSFRRLADGWCRIVLGR